MTGADLAEGVAALGRSLRASGVRVGLGDEVDAARTLARLPGADRDQARRGLRIALKLRPAEWGALDALLDELWPEAALDRNPAARAPTAAIDGRRPGRAAAEQRELPLPSPAPRGDGIPGTGPLAGGPPPPEGGGGAAGDLPGWSPEAMLRRRPFEACSAADLVAMERLLSRLAARLATRRSRRLVPTRGRGAPDLRRSLRRSVSTGGELLTFARRSRPVEVPRLVILCDTSGSMDACARFLLAFVLALRRAARSTEVFAFNTELVRLTPWLAPGRLGPTLDRLAAAVPDWAGGTRIGDCLARFVSDHLPRRVDDRTVVVILSDGLDRGEPETLGEAMRAVHARARKVVWLNPLLGDPRYEPTARGMRAALPFVDAFLPAHDLASLERLLPQLSA